MQTYVKPEVAFVNDLTQAFLFSTAMSVPATRLLKILRIFNTQARFLTQIIDKGGVVEVTAVGHVSWDAPERRIRTRHDGGLGLI